MRLEMFLHDYETDISLQRRNCSSFCVKCQKSRFLRYEFSVEKDTLREAFFCECVFFDVVSLKKVNLSGKLFQIIDITKSCWYFVRAFSETLHFKICK